VIEKEIHVYQNLAAVISDSTKKVVQFIGSREGEGTSTVVREFARVSASTFGKLVLLLDADQYHPTQHLFPIFNQSLAGRRWCEIMGLLRKLFIRLGDLLVTLLPQKKN